jgi:hypothetical protein
VPRERNSAADNWRGLRVPLLATVAAIWLVAVWYVFDSRFGALRHGRFSAPDSLNDRGEGGGSVLHPRPVAG